MKITRITVWHVPLQSHVEYRMAAGKSCATIDTVVVRLETGAAIDGWGEVCPIPHYLPAFADGVAPAIANMAPVRRDGRIAPPEGIGLGITPDADVLGAPKAQFD